MITTLRLAAVLLVLFLSPCVEAAKLVAGPMAGASGMRGASIWLQADGPGKVVIEYWDRDTPKVVLRSRLLTLQEDEDFAARVDIVALEPGRRFGYRVLIDGKLQPVPQSLQFMTQTLWQWRTDPPEWKLAFGSCAYTNEIAYDRPGKPYGGPPEAMRIYDSIASQKPDVMLWGGDYLYYREADWDSEWGLRYRWKHDRGIPQVQNLLRTGHHFAIWDDHDYGPNDSNSSFPLKGETLKLFKRYFANPTYGLPEAPGVFSNFTFNDAEFFLTDNRYYRDSDWLVAEDKSMLGAAQMRWLKNALMASVSPVKLVVVGSQVTNPLNRRESWDKFPRERDDFLKFLTDHKINGVVLLAGDRHFTEMLRTERPGSYPLYELTCSPLTSGIHADARTEHINPKIVDGTYVTEHNFCTVDFSGKNRERRLTLRGFDADGRRLWEKVIPLAELQTPR